MTFTPVRTTLTALTAALILASCNTQQAPPLAAESGTEAARANVETLALAGAGGQDVSYEEEFGGFGHRDNLATHVKALPNGKTLVVHAVGEETALNQFIAVRRYRSDGTLDATFGNNGTAILDGANGSMQAVNPEAIEVTPEGRIFIAATGRNPSPSFITERPIIFALTPNGAADSTFSVQGRFPESATFPLGNGNGSGANPTSAGDLHYDASARTLTLGGTIDPANGRSFLWSLTFNVDQPSVRKEIFVKETSANLLLHELERLPSGETLLAGSMMSDSGGGLPDAYLARVQASGQIVLKRSVFIGQGAVVRGLKLSGGKALLAGFTFPNASNGTKGFVARVNVTNLTLDATFGTNGTRLVSDNVRDLAVANDGKLVAVGSEGKRIMAARLTANGQLDTTFGTGGVALPLRNIASDSTEFALAVDVDAQNRILLGGIVKRPNVNHRNRVARLLP